MKGVCFIPPLHDKTVKKIKTETRRIVVSRTGFFNVISKDGIVKEIWQCDADGWNGEDLIPVKPRYNVGEIVYLKEPYVFYEEKHLELKTTHGLETAYKYGNKLSIEEITGSDSLKWQNKLFMPASAARYFIKITNVRAEKLQDITHEACIREGIYQHISHAKVYWMNGYDGLMFCCPKHAYAALIDRINGKGTWDSNPFVWVYEYELTNKKEDENI